MQTKSAGDQLLKKASSQLGRQCRAEKATAKPLRWRPVLLAATLQSRCPPAKATCDLLAGSTRAARPAGMFQNKENASPRPAMAMRARPAIRRKRLNWSMPVTVTEAQDRNRLSVPGRIPFMTSKLSVVSEDFADHVNENARSAPLRLAGIDPMAIPCGALLHPGRQPRSLPASPT